MMYDEDMVVRLREWCENPQDVSFGELAENSCKIADEIERMGREMDLMDYSLTEGSLIVESQKETLDKLRASYDKLEKEVERFRVALTNIKNVKLYNYVFDGYEKEIQRLATEALEGK